MKKLFLLALFAACAACAACGPAPELGDSTDKATDPGPDTLLVQVPSNQTSQLRLRAGGNTVWVDPSLALDASWRLFGRTGRNLAEAISYVPDDGFGSASVVSARRFELRLDRGHEINTMLSGLPIFVQLRTTTNHSLALWFGARFTAFSGDRGLFLQEAIGPVYLRSEESSLRYRARIELGRQGCISAATNIHSSA